MDRGVDDGTEVRFAAYAARMSFTLGHADRVRPFGDYCAGLLSAQGCSVRSIWWTDGDVIRKSRCMSA
jgi:SRSO17 transposase